MARSFFADMSSVPVDLFTWMRKGNRWPSKLALLQTMQQHYPHVFADEEEIVVSMSRGSFGRVVDQASRNRAHPGDSCSIFDRYASMRVLLVPASGYDESPSAPPESPGSSSKALLRRDGSARASPGASTESLPRRSSSSGFQGSSMKSLPRRSSSRGLQGSSKELIKGLASARLTM